jgi:hypothetical protein
VTVSEHAQKFMLTDLALGATVEDAINPSDAVQKRRSASPASSDASRRKRCSACRTRTSRALRRARQLDGIELGPADDHAADQRHHAR